MVIRQLLAFTFLFVLAMLGEHVHLHEVHVAERRVRAEVVR